MISFSLFAFFSNRKTFYPKILLTAGLRYFHDNYVTVPIALAGLNMTWKTILVGVNDCFIFYSFELVLSRRSI